MTNRHEWDTIDIIKSFYGQSFVEKAFKEMKNPYHLTLKPQFHWTDQKIKVHNFICVIGFLLATLIWREVGLKIDYKSSMNTMFNLLKNIRLATIRTPNEKNGRLKATYTIEKMDKEEQKVFESLELQDFHIKRPKFKNFSVYNLEAR